ncbi:MAG: hypothetical protein JW937_03720 [Candidatus Omnitrophica bacterium]|nr:hypothetical protein [Candidatus Omnitrophota bacterium]
MNSPKQISKPAVFSILCGSLFFIPVIGVLAGCLAVALGTVAYIGIKADPTKLRGNGVALAGVLFGIVGMIVIPALYASLAGQALKNLDVEELKANYKVELAKSERVVPQSP